MVTRAYYSKYREHTLVKREGNNLPSNSDIYLETYTYMPKSFYEETFYFKKSYAATRNVYKS